MSKGFFGNLSLLILVNILIKPFWLFGIDRSVQNTVGAEAYGIYFALFNLTLLFNIILELGINNFNNRAIAQNAENLKTYLPNLLAVKGLVAFIYAIIVMSAGLFLGYSGADLHLLCLCVINLIAVSFVLYLRSNISGLQFFKVDSIFSVADKSLMILFVGALLWFIPLKNGFDLNWFVMAQILANTLVAVAAFIFVKRQAGKLSFRIDFDVIKTLLKKAAPFALIGFLMVIYYRIDGIMLERMLGKNGPGQSGMYAAAFRILDAANMIGFLFATILLPLFSKMTAENENVNKLLKFSTNLVMVLVITMSLSIYAFSQPIMDLLYTESNTTYGLILKLLILTCIPIAVVYVFGAILVANNNLKQINYMGFFGVVFNIALNLILIPKYQAVGAAVATLTTQSIMAVLNIVLTFKFVTLDFSLKAVIKLLIYFLICLLIAEYCYTIENNWLLAFFTVAFAFLLLAFVFKIIRFSELKEWSGYKTAYNI